MSTRLIPVGITKEVAVVGSFPGPLAGGGVVASSVSEALEGETETEDERTGGPEGRWGDSEAPGSRSGLGGEDCCSDEWTGVVVA